MCSSAPPPDPAIGQAALQDSQTAAAAQQVGEDQIAWQKQQDAEYQPYYDQILNQDVSAGTQNQQQSADQWQQYQSVFEPNEKQVVSDANNWDSTANLNLQRGRAATDYDLANTQAQQSGQRTLAAEGVDPGSGRALALTIGNTGALGRESAENQATENTQMQAMQMRQQAANLGRSLPATSLGESSAGVAAGGAGTGAIGAEGTFNDAGTATGLQGYGVAESGYGSAANTLQQQWNTEAGLTMSQNQGMGALAGAGLTAAAIF